MLTFVDQPRLGRCTTPLRAACPPARLRATAAQLPGYGPADGLQQAPAEDGPPTSEELDESDQLQQALALNARLKRRQEEAEALARERAAAVAAQYAGVAALFDSECLPDDAFACVASFWLGPRGYDAAPAARPRLAMPSIELESSSSSA